MCLLNFSTIDGIYRHLLKSSTGRYGMCGNGVQVRKTLAVSVAWGKWLNLAIQEEWCMWANLMRTIHYHVYISMYGNGLITISTHRVTCSGLRAIIRNQSKSFLCPPLCVYFFCRRAVRLHFPTKVLRYCIQNSKDQFCTLKAWKLFISFFKNSFFIILFFEIFEHLKV